jgi:hypothetical protein
MVFFDLSGDAHLIESRLVSLWPDSRHTGTRHDEAGTHFGGPRLLERALLLDPSAPTERAKAVVQRERPRGLPDPQGAVRQQPLD